MKRWLPVVLVLVFFVQISSCEKDDICVEGDTPLLVVGFYDVTDTTFKSVPNLRIRALDIDSILGLESAVEFGFSDRTDSPDSILLPLRANASFTQFELISSSSDGEDGNEQGSVDTVQFNYSVAETFVSRACGFVANYDELDTLRTVFEDDWIKGISILDSTVTQSNTIHVQIFH